MDVVFKDARTGLYFTRDLEDTIQVVEDAVVQGRSYKTLYRNLKCGLFRPWLPDDELVGNLDIVVRLDRNGDLIYIIE